MQPEDKRHPPGAPAPQPVNEWAAAEENAVRWLQWLGHGTAQRSRSGADGGIDVTGTDVAAQVKWYGTAVGVRSVRELVGAATGLPVRVYFLCNAGFTRDAIAYADRVNVALFRFSPADGSISPLNSAAEQAYASAVQRHTRPTVEATSAASQFRAFYRETARDASGPTGPASKAAVIVALVPVGMCLAGALVVILARKTGGGPNWLGNAWAAWMTVACLGVLPAVVIAAVIQGRKTPPVRGSSAAGISHPDPQEP
ncbi:restriction endonuclease [Micromonospora sp. C97]|uniref:restriction endonuclease n=1 Tax=Micromonospora sp. C97 TaxID=2824883 RepID=UPI001B526AFD|nr:restriction endonuclease [Micromonospora sp. C97]